MTHILRGAQVRIAVLGGGPGGLLAALLAKRGDPGREVTVFERNRPGDTFGFGVVFSDAPGPSDQVTRAYLEKLFATQIDGCPLLVNISRWGNFRTWRTHRWRPRAGPDNRTAVALLGDAAHTAHFSVGSGTKMAMEDAIAL